MEKNNVKNKHVHAYISYNSQKPAKAQTHLKHFVIFFNIAECIILEFGPLWLKERKKTIS